MKKKILIACVFSFIILLVPITSSVGLSEDCDCKKNNSSNIINEEKILEKIVIYINIILLRYRHLPEVKEICDKISADINSYGINDIFCNILMRIGIQLEELYKIFPEGTLLYPFLLMIMFPIILLWNKYCDDFMMPEGIVINGYQ